MAPCFVEPASLRRQAPRRGGWCGCLLLLSSLLSCAAGHAGKDAKLTGASSETMSGGYELPVRAPGGSSFRELPLAAAPAETQLARLSHAQYRRTVRDLLGLGAAPEISLAPDALVGLGFDTGSGLRVDARLGPQYRALAESLARLAVSDAGSWASIVPCAPELSGCREQFLRAFGERAFRRPLSAADLSAFALRFDAAASLYQSGNAFQDGVRWTVESLLQAPEFLYRVESSAAGPLDDYELAARLSYFLFDSMPDEPLFAAARAGALRTDEQIELATRRMLREPLVLQKLVAFHEQAWQFGRFAGISPDLTSYPNVPSAFVWRIRRATTLFVRDVLQSGGGLEELLTASYAYADPGLAPLYGLSLPDAAPSSEQTEAQQGPRFQRVLLDPARRRGLLMQLGYLAAHSYAKATDPIHRGLFVIRNLLCREVPDPPPGATTTPPPPAARPIVTTRDEVALVTGQSFCPTCHGEINAPGFAFEGFDAVGQLRSVDNGAPVDSSGELVLDGQSVRFAGAIELVSALARSQEAHRCYTRRWMEYAYGRPLAVSDEPTLEHIAAESRPLADLLVAIVLSPAFRSRGVGPSPPATRAAVARLRSDERRR